MEKFFRQLLKKIPIGISVQIAGIIAGKKILERTSWTKLRKNSWSNGKTSEESLEGISEDEPEAFLEGTSGEVVEGTHKEIFERTRDHLKKKKNLRKWAFSIPQESHERIFEDTPEKNARRRCWTNSNKFWRNSLKKCWRSSLRNFWGNTWSKSMKNYI